MMILLRVLLLGALVWLGWMIWRQIRDPGRDQTPTPIEKMVKCAHCQHHVPIDSAIKVGDHHYCKQHQPDSRD